VVVLAQSPAIAEVVGVALVVAGVALHQQRHPAAVGPAGQPTAPGSG
jgi:hypothetical protein